MKTPIRTPAGPATNVPTGRATLNGLEVVITVMPAGLPCPAAGSHWRSVALPLSDGSSVVIEATGYTDRMAAWAERFAQRYPHLVAGPGNDVSWETHAREVFRSIAPVASKGGEL